jgi:hypothetical protein
MADDSFELMRQNIADRNQSDIQELRVLTELIGDCEALGDCQSSIKPDRHPRLIYSKYGLNIRPTTVPESGYWVNQNWSHPKYDGHGIFPDVQHTQLVKLADASSLRSILLERASIVEQVLTDDPIRWHHGRFWLKAAATFAGTFLTVIVLTIFLLNQ